MQHNTFIVDSFTSEAFKGNPAGVHLTREPLSELRMQSIASELNLSETAFVQIDEAAECSRPLPIRYFSPKMEIPLCGHATLASAKVLFETTDRTTVTFENIEGLELVARQLGDQIEMCFPVYDLQPAVAPPTLLSALGLESHNFCGLNRETKILMLEVDGTETVEKLAPDFRALVASHDSINGVLVTAAATDEFDFHSRYFWPWSGSDEDPVTGGTHTFMAKYWSDKLNKTQLRSFQASHRTGQMDVELTPDNRLLIRGSAVLVLAGNVQV